MLLSTRDTGTQFLPAPQKRVPASPSKPSTLTQGREAGLSLRMWDHSKSTVFYWCMDAHRLQNSSSGEHSCKTKSMNAWIIPHQIYYSTGQHFCLFLKIKMLVDHQTVLYWVPPWFISPGESQFFFQPIFINCPGVSASPPTTHYWIWRSLGGTRHIASLGDQQMTR